MLKMIEAKQNESPGKGEAIFLLIAGLILGTVFTFGMRYWNAPVTREEAVQKTATFFSYEKQYRKGRIRGIEVRFADCEQLEIDRTCITEEMLDKLDNLKTGTVVAMLVHPNSDTILELNTEKMQVLNFEDSVKRLTSEVTGFTCLGIFCYIMAVLGLLGLFESWKYKGRKHIGHEK